MTIQVHTCNFYCHRFCIVADSTICVKQHRFRHNVIDSWMGPYLIIVDSTFNVDNSYICTDHSRFYIKCQQFQLFSHIFFIFSQKKIQLLLVLYKRLQLSNHLVPLLWGQLLLKPLVLRPLLGILKVKCQVQLLFLNFLRTYLFLVTKYMRIPSIFWIPQHLRIITFIVHKMLKD